MMESNSFSIAIYVSTVSIPSPETRKYENALARVLMVVFFKKKEFYVC